MLPLDTQCLPVRQGQHQRQHRQAPQIPNHHDGLGGETAGAQASIEQADQAPQRRAQQDTPAGPPIRPGGGCFFLLHSFSPPHFPYSIMVRAMIYPTASSTVSSTQLSFCIPR